LHPPCTRPPTGAAALLLVALAAPLAPACAAHRADDTTPMPQIQTGERAKFDAAAAQFRYALDRGLVPPPVVSFSPQQQERDGVRVTVAPILAEAQPWNTWPDGGARLFNDALGYLWTIRVESLRPVRWNPSRTELAVNDTEQVFAVAPRADDVLVPLLNLAAWEAAVGARSDFALRMRRAGDFRHAYLTSDATTGSREGIVVFPAPSASIQCVAMQLTVGLVTDEGKAEEFRFLFE
jgi:hypothetical protein